MSFCICTNPENDGNYGLWVIMMCQFNAGSSGFNKCTTIVCDVDRGGCVWARGQEGMGILCTFYSVLL